MFQTFGAATSPDQGPPRLAELRRQIAEEGLDGFLVPRADAHQGEYVAPCDERLAWLTGFTGSAGFAAILTDQAGVFIDGRYRLQVRAQVSDEFTPVHWPETSLVEWLKEKLPDGGNVGYDPWLHSAEDIRKQSKTLAVAKVALVPIDNLVDRIWRDQPTPPDAKFTAQPIEFAGETSAKKRARVAADIPCVLTLPDSIAWLLNMRGTDIERNPVPQAFAILHPVGRVDLFAGPGKANDITEHLGPDVTVHPTDTFLGFLRRLSGPVQIDPKTCPQIIQTTLHDAGIASQHAPDPCILPKALKNEVEIAGARAAHLRDAVAMVQFLAWLAEEAPANQLTEIDIVSQLESFRRATNQLRDISFETICGAGPNGAIVHYRVTEDSNRPVKEGDLLLVDSGGQYSDGTTDITRTMAIGTPTDDHRKCYTRVLQGMIAISRVRFPKGVAGQHLDALARFPLWTAGMDYDHGTGHGVGSYLSVHEGPQGISRRSEVALEPGMILSNEPGYYREGAFGIRIENLIYVVPAPALSGADDRDMLAFDTLTYVPMDSALIDTTLLNDVERDWINTYHRTVFEKIGPLVDDHVHTWLAGACSAI